MNPYSGGSCTVLFKGTANNNLCQGLIKRGKYKFPKLEETHFY